MMRLLRALLRARRIRRRRRERLVLEAVDRSTAEISVAAEKMRRAADRLFRAAEEGSGQGLADEVEVERFVASLKGIAR